MTLKRLPASLMFAPRLWKARQFADTRSLVTQCGDDDAAISVGPPEGFRVRVLNRRDVIKIGALAVLVGNLALWAAPQWGAYTTFPFPPPRGSPSLPSC